MQRTLLNQNQCIMEMHATKELPKSLYCIHPIFSNISNFFLLNFILFNFEALCCPTHRTSNEQMIGNFTQTANYPHFVCHPWKPAWFSGICVYTCDGDIRSCQQKKLLQSRGHKARALCPLIVGLRIMLHLEMTAAGTGFGSFPADQTFRREKGKKIVLKRNACGSVFPILSLI